ncbi:periplasmic nitrate reductase NapAB, small subunit, periplasmic diheme cytochrome c550 protein [Campylobacter blaseri]|uniref:Periplasmic nitrate reductase, electron transfer subunit n=1 Tax=Campylobacter blaseri TaxID=2042961 RepID=A0A2P8R0N5_9BACT|nr:nitrate reductase cytochrome c-type subunit [Campylobacter blaseri]PSM52063.1 nitrate reductase [Campylobacter blaseri]PSM53848.1 nitrate reductase [Campylobacter blaseri]QKF85599.1 periplasmic nitrate reductase NapAB, small subunit, periplasmic diheme cytochrome c550 protein [Campylobacter blaseri]
MKKIILVCLSIACVWAAGINDESIGLRKVSLMDENKVKIEDINYSAQPPGMSTRFDRSFENAPPMIPHDLDGLLPITTELNMCTTCHMPEFAKDVGSTSVPKSHLVDLRTGKDDKGMLDGSRYNCVQCHAPQANTEPLVKNKFHPNFRDEKSKTSSNLIDILNQGVK